MANLNNLMVSGSALFLQNIKILNTVSAPVIEAETFFEDSERLIDKYLTLSGGTLTGTLQVGESSQTSFPTVGLKVHDTRNDDFAPNVLEKGINFFFTNENMPDSHWWSGIHIRGYHGIYNAWNIVGPGSNTDQTTTPLYIRTSNAGSTWGSWRKIYDSSNPPTASEVGAATSGHTHTTSIATSSGTNQLTLAFGTKYAITAGGTSYIFTTPANPNTDTTYTFATGDDDGTFKVTPSGGTASSISIKGLGSAAYTDSADYVRGIVYDSSVGSLKYYKGEDPQGIPIMAIDFAASSHTHSASDINSGTLAIARIPTGTSATTVALGNHSHSGYLSTSGGTVSGTLILSKTTDLSGTANNSPALIIGGTASQAHIEIDNNEIQAKDNATTVQTLYLNGDGGNVYLGSASSSKIYLRGTNIYKNGVDLNSIYAEASHNHNADDINVGPSYHFTNSIYSYYSYYLNTTQTTNNNRGLYYRRYNSSSNWTNKCVVQSNGSEIQLTDSTSDVLKVPAVNQTRSASNNYYLYVWSADNQVCRSGSSIRYKDIITEHPDEDYYHNCLMKLHSVEYMFKGGNRLILGMVAEDVYEVMPHGALVEQDEDYESGIRVEDYDPRIILQMVVMESQRSNKIIEEQKKKIEELENKINKIMEYINMEGDNIDNGTAN